MTEQMTDALAVALAKAQGEMQNAKINKENPHFQSRYADLAAIRDATIPALTKHGLCLFHVIVRSGEQWIVRGIIRHGESGGCISSEFPIMAPFDKPQYVGSAITYAKRYTWAALCGISAEEDDDGNAAQDPERNIKQVERKPRKPADNVIQITKPKAEYKPPVEIAPIGNDWVGWGQEFIECIRTAKTTAEADDWMKINGVHLDMMEKEVPKVHKRLSEAIHDAYSNLGTGQ